MNATNHFTDRETGQVIRVEKVNMNYASITVVSKLVSTWMMPVALYDTEFVTRYRPLDIGDVKVPPDFRMPANAHLWDDVPAPQEAPVVVAPPPPSPVLEVPVIPDDESDDGAEVVAAYGYQPRS